MIHIYKEDRPWGSFERFTKNVPSTVKILTVHKGQSTSLQFHHKRQEFWRVLKGNPTLTIGDQLIPTSPGFDFFIDKRVNHRISAPENTAVLLEISLGDFDEDDIVRLEDSYGRAPKA